jgi:muconolactone delta-isomerase
MNARMSEEEARDAKIRELTEKNAAYTKALIAKGDVKTIHDVGDDVTNYLAFAQDDLNKLVTGELTFEQVRDKVIEADAEVAAIEQVEKMEKDREEEARWARIERMAFSREIGVLIWPH